VKVYDNYLTGEDWLELSNTLTSSHFPWFASNGIVRPDDGQQGFTHTFYTIGQTQEYYNLVYPIVNTISPLALIRVKGNCVPKTTQHTNQGMHIDIEGTFTERLTGVYYVNTCNGYTQFEDGTKVDSAANRLVIFDGNMKHESVTQTDTPFRYVINFNWIGKY
jgi:hypothetical protein